MAFVDYASIEPVDINEKEFLPTGIINLDRWIIGVPRSGVTVLSGLAGCGKSTLLGSLICEFSRQKQHGLICSFEMKNAKLQSWLNAQLLGSFNMESEIGLTGKEIYSPKTRKLQDKAQGFLNKYIKVYDNSDFNVAKVIEDIKYEISQCRRLDYVIIDNLMKMNYESEEADKYETQSAMVKEFQNLAQQTGIAFIVVAHPKKIKTLLRRDDISGSGDIVNVADLVLIMHKITDDFKVKAYEYWGWQPKKNKLEDKNEIYQKGFDVIIEIAKSRDFGEAEGTMIGQYYDKRTRRLLNARSEHKNYMENE